MEAFKKEAKKFSLLEDGTLDKPCARLFLVNVLRNPSPTLIFFRAHGLQGTDDEIFPIDDMFVALEHGGPKEARYVHPRHWDMKRLMRRLRFVKDTKHMGEPSSFVIILDWVYKMLDIKSHPGQQLKTIPFKAKY